VDLVVFGRRAGKHIADYVKHADFLPLGKEVGDAARGILARLGEAGEGPDPDRIRGRMQEVMMRDVGIYRRGREMAAAAETLKELRRHYQAVRLRDTSRAFNTHLLEILELENLLDLAYLSSVCALNRTESRGSHAREDRPDRDDENWLRHTLARLEGEEVKIGYKSVDTSVWPPKPRTY
jgi:succinate dehydrogenase / fumarate reductase flavoprotein subunit